MNEFILLLLFVLVHLCADFYLQPATWVADKNKRHYKSMPLLLHAGLHAIGIFLVCSWFAAVSALEAFGYALLVLSSHWLLDVAKSYVANSLAALLLDQLLHLAVLSAIWLSIYDYFSILTLSSLAQFINEPVLIVSLAYLLVLKPTSVLVAIFLKPWTAHLKPVKPVRVTDSLQFAGQQIGYLERLLILSFILLNQFAAIGFLIAAKSVFRFGELQHARETKLTEYVLLGTLASFACTLLIGLLASALLGRLPLGV
jgi:hypothetical protein